MDKMNTREKILDGAQKLFLENGYTKTTLRMIAKEVNVNLGLLPYYFDKKENIGKEIYSRYMTKFIQRIEYKKFNIQNSIEHMMLTYLLLQYYMNLEPGLLKMYEELVKEDVLKYSMEGYSFHSLALIEKEYELNLEKEDIMIAMSIIKGVERAFVLGRIDQQFEMDYFDINIKMIRCALLYLGVSREEIDKNITVIKEKLITKGMDFHVFE